MSSNEEIWQHLRNANLFPCDGNTNVEINLHDPSSRILRSFFFNCLRFEDGTQFSEVEAIITHNGIVEVTFNGIEIPQRVDLEDIILIIDEMENQLRESLRNFLENRDNFR